MNTLIKRLLLLLVLATVLVPALQARFHFVEEPGLNGAFITTPHPELTWEGLKTNSFQPALEKYIEERLGFRTFLIKARNQLSFWLFHVARSSDIVVGEHGVLFQPGPIQSYLGKDLLTEDEVRFRVRRLRVVQRDLRQRGVHLLLVLAPNKARFEPEDLPGYLQPAPGTVTNYDLFARALRADSVSWLDMVPVFAQWKTQKPYPLFPRGGTHWSGYGATLAADTILRQLEQLGQLRFPTVRTAGPPVIVHSSDSLRGNDNDINAPLNLLLQRETTPLAYRRLKFEAPGPGQVRPPALFVGDSFTWGLMLFSPYMQRQFADDTRFWYYNNAVYLPDSVYHDTGEKPGGPDFRQQVESRRFVVLLLTEHNLIENEFGFTEQVYHLYHPLTPADQAAIDQLAAKLTSQATWKEQAQDPEAFAAQTREKARHLYEMQNLR